MRIFLPCEFSGEVREAFRKRGHYAVSCDLLDTEIPGLHYLGPAEDIINDGWDMMIAFPPCTYLASSGARWWPERQQEQKEALEFVNTLLNAPIDKIVLENPIGRISTAIRKPDQIIQPWQFGHGEVKATCLWLKNVPLLVPTDIVDGRTPRVHYASPGPNRWRVRSRTLTGIAEAMADQWG